MPWLETSPVEQRERFIDAHQQGPYTMTELCERYECPNPIRFVGHPTPTCDERG